MKHIIPNDESASICLELSMLLHPFLPVIFHIIIFREVYDIIIIPAYIHHCAYLV